MSMSTKVLLLFGPPMLPNRQNIWLNYSTSMQIVEPTFFLPHMGLSPLNYGTLVMVSCLLVRILQQVIFFILLNLFCIIAEHVFLLSEFSFFTEQDLIFY